MVFNDAIRIISDVLKSTGTKINESGYDGIIVKKLEASNTLDDGRTTNQTHIAITGSQMDIFPYLRSEGYFNNSESDAALKKYFITQVPVILTETNVRYLEAENGIQNSEISFIASQNKTQTSIIRSKRANQADQIQVSLINCDGKDFIKFRKLLHSNSYLIILKRKEKFEYLAFGIIPDRGIVGDGGLAQLNNRFFKLDTKTIVNIENVLPNNNDEGSKRIEGGTNILLYGVPGSGKSWTIEHEYCKPSTNVERLVFHPDYTYADFIGQILPNVAENGQVSYKFTPGPFTTILKDAYQNPDKEYILIIEEINRGNAPAIFGEVFQLLDRIKEDNNNGEYPTGTSEYGITNENIAKIVYGDSKQKIRIPSNLSIIGTMNTSDQNVFTLDTAFQRRWEMRLIENNFEHVDKRLADAQILDTGVTWQIFCDKINSIIVGNSARMTSSEDKRLGAYFVHLQDLYFDDRMNQAEYDSLREKEENNSLSEQDKIRIAEIRNAMKQNRKFPEKVIKYLWDDAFKFNREIVFNTTEYQSLEQIIRKFMYSSGAERFDMFKDNIKNAFLHPEE